MVGVAELMVMSRDQLVAEALRLAAEGDSDRARMAAILANDGGECPFSDPWLRAAWDDRARLASHKPPLSRWRIKAGRTSAAASVREEDWGDLGL